MTWKTETNLSVAHALHRVAWHGADERLARYVDADKRLRRAARLELPTPPEQGQATVSDALTADRRVAWDTEWFDIRWENGERDGMRDAAERIAESVSGIPDGGLLGEPWTLIASPVLRGISAACPIARRVGVGPHAEGIMAVLTAVGVRLSHAMPMEGLNAGERRHVSLHVAATAILRATGDDEALTPWLAHAITFLLPLAAGRESYNAMIRGVAAQLLDQPPGEVDRISEGLCRGQASRLHRAWRRGFFVPAKFDLDAWVSQDVG